jgi:hypothetical protein
LKVQRDVERERDRERTEKQKDGQRLALDRHRIDIPLDNWIDRHKIDTEQHGKARLG